MAKPVLSVVIPVYNTAGTLKYCLDSVLTQDFPDLEVVCIDDASSDGSLECLRGFSETDQRVKVLRHEQNRGRLEARRTGVDHAEGEFIMFLDSDDSFDNGLCGAAVDAIRKHDADMLQFSARQINVESGKKDIILPFTGDVPGKDLLNRFFITREISSTLWQKIYRSGLCRKAYREIPKLQSNMGEDILISFFLAYFAGSFSGVNTRKKYNYYLGKGISSTVMITPEKYRHYCEMSQLSRIVREFLQKNNAEMSAISAYNHMTVRLLSDCCSAFALVPETSREQASEMFWRSWRDVPGFERFLLDAFADRKGYIDSIYRSESYKLGNAVITPLRNIKAIISGN